MSRAAVILCGGRSSRMGRAKAWLPWFGVSMVEHVVDCLRPIVDEVVVVTSPDLDLPPLDVRVVVDEELGLGPLAGIRNGLRATTSESAFVTSVDSPYLSREFVLGIFALGVAAAPVEDDHVQVLSAVYPGDAWKQAEALLAEDIRRPLRLLEALGYKAIRFPPLPPEASLSPSPRPWHGFNTPAQYLDAIRKRDPEASAEIEFLGRAARGRVASTRRVPVGTLGEVFACLPDDSDSLISNGRVSKAHLVSLGGRDLVRDLAIPVGPGEKLSVIDALAGG